MQVWGERKEPATPEVCIECALPGNFANYFKAICNSITASYPHPRTSSTHMLPTLNTPWLVYHSKILTLLVNIATFLKQLVWQSKPQVPLEIYQAKLLSSAMNGRNWTGGHFFPLPQPSWTLQKCWRPENKPGEEEINTSQWNQGEQNKCSQISSVRQTSLTSLHLKSREIFIANKSQMFCLAKKKRKLWSWTFFLPTELQTGS